MRLHFVALCLKCYMEGPGEGKAASTQPCILGEVQGREKAAST